MLFELADLPSVASSPTSFPSAISHNPARVGSNLKTTQQPDDDAKGSITDESSDAMDAQSEEQDNDHTMHHLEDETLTDEETSAGRDS